MPQKALNITLLIGLLFLLPACAAIQPPPTVNLRRGEVQRGAIDAVVSATGTLLPEAQIGLSFEQVGIVRELYVQSGDVVVAGQPLARLDTRRLEIAVRQAELALQAQQLNYDRLFLPPSDAQLAAAYAAIESAQAAYEQAAQGTDPEALRIAEMEYQRAYNAYIQADMQLRAVQWYLPESQLVAIREQANQALIQVEIARLRLDQLQAGPDEFALAAARAGIAQAQADLARLLEGPSDLEVARAQVQIDQAQLALDRARQQLEAATLRAPVDGIVAEVNVQVGAPAPTNRPALTLIDASHLHVEVAIDEMDIARLTVGQPARITLDALPGETLEGQVTAIAPAATSEGGVVTYQARIDLAPTDLHLLVGMTVTAEIIVQRLENVLLVPNWAIRFDRDTQQAYVSVLAPDGITVQEVPVVLGLRGDPFSQVVAGVEEGQTVAVSVTPEQITFFGGEE